jgi:hypothetical protein
MDFPIRDDYVTHQVRQWANPHFGVMPNDKKGFLLVFQQSQRNLSHLYENDTDLFLKRSA